MIIDNELKKLGFYIFTKYDCIEYFKSNKVKKKWTQIIYRYETELSDKYIDIVKIINKDIAFEKNIEESYFEYNNFKLNTLKQIKALIKTLIK